MYIFNYGAPSIFNSISTDVLDSIEAMSVSRSFKDGQIIHMRRDESVSQSLIRSGGVKLGSVSADGSFTALAMLGPGQFFGNRLSLTSTRSHDALAIGSTDIYQFIGESFQNLLDQEPSLVRALLNMTTMNMDLFIDLYEDTRKLTTTQRLAKLLLTARRDGQEHYVLAVRQIDISNLLGVSDVTLGKSLTKLQSLRLTKTSYRKLTILSASGLSNWLHG